jgi:hypothetical protein
VTSDTLSLCSLLSLTAFASACQRTDRSHTTPTPSADDGADSSSVSWGSFPSTTEEALALHQRLTLRVVTDQTVPTAEQLLASLERTAVTDIVSGRRAIFQYLEHRLDRDPSHPAIVLFGTYHDSGEQIAAFNQWISPSGLSGLTHVVAEQFEATGRWESSPEKAPSNESTLIAEYLSSGTQTAFDALALSHSSHDYAAWKYDYLDEVMAVAITARARSVSLLGCDLPRTWHPENLSHQLLDPLRESHCALSLQTALRHHRGSPARVAMLWGQAHVRSSGFPRYFPPDVTVLSVYVFGHRRSPASAEYALRETVILNDPLLWPMEGRENSFFYLLPDRWTQGSTERVRTEKDQGDSSGLYVSSETAGQFEIATRTLSLQPEAQIATSLDSGNWTYRLHIHGQRVLGSVQMTQGTRVSIDFDPAHRSTRIVYAE